MATAFSIPLSSHKAKCTANLTTVTISTTIALDTIISPKQDVHSYHYQYWIPYHHLFKQTFISKSPLPNIDSFLYTLVPLPLHLPINNIKGQRSSSIESSEKEGIFQKMRKRITKNQRNTKGNIIQRRPLPCELWTCWKRKDCSYSSWMI